MVPAPCEAPAATSTGRAGSSPSRWQQVVRSPGGRAASRTGMPRTSSANGATVVTADVTWPEGGAAKPKIGQPEISLNEQGSRAPHIVWGKLNTEGISQDNRNTHFNAFITSRPNEKLTENSPGCMLGDGYWIVQCGSFQSSWKAGEVLTVVFDEKESGYNVVREIELTYDSADEAEELYFESVQNLPTRYGLAQNYPNPFNPRTTIPYQILREGRVKISIFNMLGQEIYRLVDEIKDQGHYEVVWNGRDEDNKIVGSDIYLVRMEAGSFIKHSKITFMK